MTVERLAAPFEWIFAALDEAVIATDLEGTIYYWNAAAERLYGWSAVEAIGRNVAELTVPAEVAPSEFSVRRRDGSTFVARVTDLPVFDEAGALTGIVGLSSNVGVVRDEADLRHALSAARVGTWRQQPGSSAFEWDAATEAMHGLATGSFDGTIEAWIDAVHPDDRARVLAERDSEALEYRTAVGDRWLEARGRGSVGVVLDVTDRKRAEHALREDAQMIETLNHIGSALVAELDLERIVQAVTDAATLLTGAQFGAFFYNVVDSAGESYTLYTISGVDPAEFEKFPMPRNTEIFAPTFAGASVVRLDDVTQDPRYGQNPPHHGMPPGHLPVRSYLAVPVVSRTGEVHGGLFFGHGDCGVFGERDERLIVGIAGHAAIAIENARLYQAEQEHRRYAEEAAGRLSRLNAMALRLADARSVSEAAEAIVSDSADAVGAGMAVVCGRSEDGRLLEALACWPDAGLLPDRWRAIPLSAPIPIVEAFHAGELVVLRSPAERDSRYPELSGVTAAANSFAAIPLEVEGRSHGVLALSFPDEREFPDEECAFLVAVGLQAGQALGRAQLADAERRAARTLQQSLLPPGDLMIPGIDVASRYHAFGAATEVGGDFYDVFPTGDGGYAVVMGDVRGKGIQSAAVTALARYTVRAATQLGQSPADTVRLVNRAIFEQEDPERFCTIVDLMVRPAVGGEAGAFDVDLVCGGHPLPLLVSGSTGAVRPIGVPGTVVGLFDDPELHEVRERLMPGDVLVLFTDGVLEARSPDGRFEPELLAKVLAGVAGTDLSAEQVASAIERAVLRFEGGMPRDDMAVVVLKVPA